MKIIGLTGKAGAGKDTAGEFILRWCRAEGIRAERFAFADILKVSAARALGFRGDTAECVAFCNDLKQDGRSIVVFNTAEHEPGNVYTKRVISCSGRAFLQHYGTEAHRDVFGQDFWVEALDSRLAQAAVDVAVITDVRFRNEARMIRGHDGEVWEVVWPELPQSDDTHSSEAGLPDGAIEFQIINDFPRGPTGLEEFEDLVCRVCEANLA